ncbi:MAG: hypothetical protein NVS3B21_31660 [Acidimicrobiales bacterium]
MRIRSLKPFVWEDEKIGQVSRDARLLFIALITMADDEGRFRTLPSVICGHAYPYDSDAPKKVSKWMDELRSASLVVLYGEHYGYLPKWESHQRISHRTPSLLPTPSGGVPE